MNIIESLRGIIICYTNIMAVDEPDNIEDFTKQYLRRIVGTLEGVVSDLSVLKETTGRLDLRLRTVEGHMTGFMSSARFLEIEIDALRGRVEALEERMFRTEDPS